MKRNHNKKVFSDYSKVGCFDSNFNIMWCDDERLFRRIAVSHERISSKLVTTDNGNTAVHFFLYKGCYHRAKINQLPNGEIICRISREITDDEVSIEDLFDYIDEVSHCTLNIVAMSDLIEDYVRQTRYIKDELHYYCFEQKRQAISIYNKCQNIIKAFNNDSDNDFIDLNKYLIRTLDVVQHITKRFSKNISFYIDPVFPATKINYSKFELALFNLIRIGLLYSSRAEDLHFYIYRTSLSKFEVETSFKINREFRSSECKLEMHAVKHIFKKLDGRFEFSLENNFMYAKGCFEAEFAFNKNVIRPEKQIEFIGNAELFERKKNSDKYLKIYSYKSAKNNMLASNVSELDDIDDKEIKFVEMFFGDIIAND